MRFRHLGIMVLLVLCTVLWTACNGLGKESPPEASPGGQPAPIEENGQRPPSAGGEPEPSNEEVPGLPPGEVSEQLRSLTLEQKIGQMLIAGINGETANAEAQELIEKHHVGGIILYKRNSQRVDQLLRLVNDLKRLNSEAGSVPLLVSVDEEGGRVTRLPAELKKLPASGKIGETGQPEFAYAVGQLLGKQLNAFGINMNFAPVLDVHSNPANPVIGDRAIGSTAEQVSSLGIQVMKGIRDEAVIPVVKHFPGHGDTSVDSHLKLPVVEHDLQRLQSMELAPFAAAIREGAEVVMVAHLLLPKLDDQYPASMSKPIITGLLREQMHFDGVVVTDDMTMGAIAENYSLKDAVVQSVLAGSDLLLVGHGFDNVVAVIDALKEAVAQGLLSEQRIDESVSRILRLKHEFKLSDEPREAVDTESLNREVQGVLEKYMP